MTDIPTKYILLRILMGVMTLATVIPWWYQHVWVVLVPLSLLILLIVIFITRPKETS